VYVSRCDESECELKHKVGHIALIKSHFEIANIHHATKTETQKHQFKVLYVPTQYLPLILEVKH